MPEVSSPTNEYSSQETLSNKVPSLCLFSPREDRWRDLFSPSSQSSILGAARHILEQEGRAIAMLAERLDKSFIEAVSLLLHCKGNVLVCGMGKAGLVGRKIAATFASTGTRSHFLHPAEAIHGDLGAIGHDDLLIILSYSGQTEEILRLLPSLKEMGCPLIAMTACGDSTLGLAAEVTLELGTLQEADFLGLAPSTSTTVMMALGDALALSVSRLRGFCDEDFARYHPGGSLGRKLSRVEDYMRPIAECRLSAEEKTIRQIFVESHLPGRRSGAILLVDLQGKLTGIFTDSDLAKLFERRDDQLLDQPVANLMTRSPQYVRQGIRMLDAIAIMQGKKISELPVLNESNVPIGILDITDLFSFFPEQQ